MRIRKPVALVAAAAAVLASACLSNPDTRGRTPEVVVQDGHGGWVLVVRKNQQALDGELIAIDTRGVFLLAPDGHLVREPIDDVDRAELFEYETAQTNVAIWGGIGAASAISHGFWAVFSVPTWILLTTLIAAGESHAAHLVWPSDSWAEFAKWARFPQGLPATVGEQDLLRQNRAPVVPAAPPGQLGPPGATAPAPAMGAAGSAAGSAVSPVIP